MASSTERLRRLSYAGPASPNRDKSRRISYSGPNSNGVTRTQEPISLGQAEDSDTFNLSTMMYNLENLGTNRMDPKSRSRRVSRHNEESFTCSQQSILSDIDRFVRAVKNMDATVLLPSRLQDIDLNSEDVKIPINASIANTDLMSFFQLVKDVKNELLWGSTPASLPLLNSSQRTTPRHMKHIRQPSDDSLGSTGSDPETDSDLESVTTDRDLSEDSSSNHLALSFRHHLQALQAIMHQLTESADFLSSKYQESIDAIPQ